MSGHFKVPARLFPSTCLTSTVAIRIIGLSGVVAPVKGKQSVIWKEGDGQQEPDEAEKEQTVGHALAESTHVVREENRVDELEKESEDDAQCEDHEVDQAEEAGDGDSADEPENADACEEFGEEVEDQDVDEGEAPPKKVPTNRPTTRRATVQSNASIGMISDGIKTDNEREGSTRSTLKDYIFRHYNVSYTSMEPNFRNAVKEGVKQGVLKYMSGMVSSSTLSIDAANW